MKIIHFISHFPYPNQHEDPRLAARYVCSGGEWAAYHLCVELAKAGHEIVVATGSAGLHDERESRGGLSIHRYGSRMRVGETLLAPGMFFRPPGAIGRPDIVHIHHTTPPGGMAGLACNQTWHCPLVVTHHGFEKPDSYGDLLRRATVSASARWYVGRLLRAATRIICISPVFPARSRHLGKFRDKIVIIPNGVDPAEFHTDLKKSHAREELGLPETHRYGLFLGSLIPPKGLGILLQSMPAILRACGNFVLLVVGRGPSEALFRQQARELGVADSVRFEGYVGEARRRLAYYRAGDVLILPSYLSEMFPLVLLEGAASGSAMVASDLDIFRWFFTDHGDGVVSPAGDADRLGAAVIEVLQDERLRTRLSERAHSRVGEFSWPTIARQTISLYEDLLSKQIERGGQ